MERDLLLEIGSEEIPARFVSGILADLKEKTEKKISDSLLGFKEITVLGTPRRLILHIEKLSLQQGNLVKELKGPPVAAGETAAAGFARSHGLKPEKLTARKIESGEYYFARLDKKGEKTEKLLPAILPEIISSLHLPISMLWGKADFKFIRPIHWILALYGTKIIKFELAGIKSSSSTFSHRFSGHPGKTEGQKIKIESANLNKFKTRLSKNLVLADPNERKEKIKNDISKLCKENDLKPDLDEELLEENTYLCEYPIAILGRFDPKYLELPKEVLSATIKKNLKSFSTLSKEGNPKPAFIIISSGRNGKRAAPIKAGNEKVLVARLSDAKFFYDEDIKTPLYQRVEKLRGVCLHAKLGNLHDKMGRILELGRHLAQDLDLTPDQRKNIFEIAKLCKTDLLTSLVCEFPSLQGIMGKEYYLKEGGSQSVARGIYEHYLPRFAGDELPASIEGTAVSIADKIDTLVGFIGIKLIPTGSEDPFGLRRLTYGILKILIAKNLNLSLEGLIDVAVHTYKSQPNLKSYFEGAIHEIRTTIMEFFKTRLKNMLIEEKVKPDLVEAVFGGEYLNISESYTRALILQKDLKSGRFKQIFLTGDRIARITKDTHSTHIRTELLAEPQEKVLYDAFTKLKAEMIEKLSSKDYQGYLNCLSEFAYPINKFFEEVMVMVENEDLKNNRLALLKNIDNLFKRMADFTKVAM